MTSITLKKYSVKFPYEKPYDLQKVYMEKVLTCLDDGKHGVLESPTGTGKTLCLFAPVAAWVKEKKKELYKEINDSFERIKEGVDSPEKLSIPKRSKVWYTSRTHAQIAQTIAEVRKCNIENLNIRVVGSRDQLCINQSVLEEKESYVKIVKCKGLVKDKQCPYYSRLQKQKNLSHFVPGEVLDIEDLVSVGKTQGLCPFFMTKDALDEADIVLLPYNYIVDRDARMGNSLQLENDIVIFDEGHNIPQKCEESYEFTLTLVDILTGIKGVEYLLVVLRRGLVRDKDLETSLKEHIENAEFILQILNNLEREIKRLPMSNDLKPVSSLYEFFERAGIQAKSSERIFCVMDAFQMDAHVLNLPGDVIFVFHLLEKMLIVTFGPTIKLFDQKTIDHSFKYGITVDKDKPNNSKKISLFCFNPSFGIQTLLQLGVQSIIITSGTLSPIKNFIYELGLPDPVTLENEHIAKKCQVPFIILGTGVNNTRMDSSYNNRKEPSYVFSLGMTLTNLISSIPDGVLLLFASYAMLDYLKEAWESNHGIWKRLTALKRVFIEPRGKEEFINCMENFKRAIDSGNGAVLMGVLRGKISEGMDFKDQYCRGVFIIGVPFPPVMDPRVKGKQNYAEELTYFNQQKNVEEKVYGDRFITVEAMKVTNQAIGRVIRHARDYGAIILVDYRFARPDLLFNVSAWLRKGRPTPKNFQETKKLLREFFRDIHLGKLGIEEIRCQQVDDNGCPVAENIYFEEYDHKTAVRIKAPSNTFSTVYANYEEYDHKIPVTNVEPFEAKPSVDVTPSKATLAYRNEYGKSTIVYDDTSSDEENSLSNTSTQKEGIVTYQNILKEEDIAIVSAMNNLGSSENNRAFSEANTPLKANTKRKYLGEECDNQESLIKSPCLERKQLSALPNTMGDAF